MDTHHGRTGSEGTEEDRVDEGRGRYPGPLDVTTSCPPVPWRGRKDMDVTTRLEPTTCLSDPSMNRFPDCAEIEVEVGESSPVSVIKSHCKTFPTIWSGFDQIRGGQ